MTPLLEISGATKRFGAVEALVDVDLIVNHGEVVALAGDNGAGKSTLIKAISGVQPADAGHVSFEGRQVHIRGPHDASSLGIAVVYQDLALCDNLDVVANLFLGAEEREGAIRLMDEIGMEEEATTLLRSLSVRLPSVRAEVGTLSGGQRQSVAISRALLGEPKLVILDEPTAALGVSQTQQVLELVLRLKERGLGVLIVSHNLADVFQVADRIVVLRLGRNAGELAADAANHQAVVAAITGAAGVIA
ncbi:MAG TPA: ATP-binding cassette domain-containing protein [Solirubrobacter sp.]|nr:ATP-binding cassette domain-containing protein [Solirubrobacter sp.]